MTFYLKPPRGEIELDKMIDCLQQRLEFLESLINHHSGDQTGFKPPRQSGCFVEGTAIDRASHYLLRLVSAKVEGFERHVTNCETNLFSRRLALLVPHQVRALLQTCRRHCQELLDDRVGLSQRHTVFLGQLANVCSDILRKPGGLQHVFNATKEYSHPSECQTFILKVPYRACLGLVARREATLRRGEALVPCSRWPRLLTEMFRAHLQHGFADLEHSGCLQEAHRDPRIGNLARLVSHNFLEQAEGPRLDGTIILTARGVWEQMANFPPCVANTLSRLKRDHRIGHHARVALTLFLKEAGMPIREALRFWQAELSQHHSGSACCHSWQKDGKRFTYSVRHMYGLEGARKNYAASSCHSIQSQLLAPGAVGGCPFSHLPEIKLVPLLHTPDIPSCIASTCCSTTKGQETLVKAQNDNLKVPEPTACCSKVSDQGILAGAQEGPCHVPDTPQASTSTKGGCCITTKPTGSQKSPQDPQKWVTRQAEVLGLSARGLPMTACQKFLQYKLGLSEPPLNMSKPSHFYTLCRDKRLEF